MKKKYLNTRFLIFIILISIYQNNKDFRIVIYKMLMLRKI